MLNCRDRSDYLDFRLISFKQEVYIGREDTKVESKRAMIILVGTWGLKYRRVILIITSESLDGIEVDVFIQPTTQSHKVQTKACWPLNIRLCVIFEVEMWIHNQLPIWMRVESRGCRCFGSFLFHLQFPCFIHSLRAATYLCRYLKNMTVKPFVTLSITSIINILIYLRMYIYLAISDNFT